MRPIARLRYFNAAGVRLRTVLSPSDEDFETIEQEGDTAVVLGAAQGAQGRVAIADFRGRDTPRAGALDAKK